MNGEKIKELAISDIKAWAAKRGLNISDEVATNVLDDMAASVEKTIVNGSSPGTPRGLLPEERECCGTFPRTPHRSTCAKYRGKFKHSNAKGQRGAACGASAAPTGCASNGDTEDE